MDLHERALPDGVLLEHLRAFQTLYREHCEARARTKCRRPVILIGVHVGRGLQISLRLPVTGRFGRDDQPPVPSSGDAVEILLEVQPEQRDGVAQPVSCSLQHSRHLCTVIGESDKEGCGLVQAQRVGETPAQVVPGGAVQVRAGAALDERVRQPAVPDAGGDADPGRVETHPQ